MTCEQMLKLANELELARNAARSATQLAKLGVVSPETVDGFIEAYMEAFAAKEQWFALWKKVLEEDAAKVPQQPMTSERWVL